MADCLRAEVAHAAALQATARASLLQALAALHGRAEATPDLVPLLRSLSADEVLLRDT